MKNKIKHIVLTIMLIIATLMTSCTKSDNEVEWGITKIYMPQAYTGTAFYAVPNGKNYSIDTINNKINISLGVYRSKLQKLESFSVQVAIDNDTINELINNGLIAKTALMPSEIYTIPSSVVVPDGKRDMSFNLILDKDKLMAFKNNPTNNGLSLALAVYISNPTKYELNIALSKTIVIVNVAKLLSN